LIGEKEMYYNGSGPDPSAVCAAEKETGSLKKAMRSTSGAGKSDEWDRVMLEIIVNEYCGGVR
jgi:hypothetical protein